MTMDLFSDTSDSLSRDMSMRTVTVIPNSANVVLTSSFCRENAEGADEAAATVSWFSLFINYI